MEHIETSNDEEARALLLGTAKSLVMQGDNDFSVPALCAQAGVDHDAFRAHFSGKTALMAALMRAPAAVEITPAVSSAGGPVSKAEQTSEPSVPTPDAWLERRLRVFERALNALEAKAEVTAREQARVIAQLEERLKGTAAPMVEAAPQAEDEPATAPVTADVETAPAVMASAKVEDEPVPVTATAEAEQAPAAAVACAPEQEAAAPEAGDQAEPVAKQDMANGLPSVTGLEEPQIQGTRRMRWLALAAAALVAVFAGIGLWLGNNGATAIAKESDGVTHRQVAKTVFHKTMALADAGDPRAQARLALAYLRGQGTAGDVNAALLWTNSAAHAGNPVAQYLLGALYQQGDHIKADPAAAFGWFSRAAEKGNLKAMHNLAIAYAQGLGTTKDEAKAAEWFTRAAERGYVDSAFDLAVLYERGEGVTQDLKQALKWYDVAALAGDKPSKERSDFLRSQMNAGDIKLATNAALAFAPLPALDEANSL
jgi:TPR repeat protein